MIWFDVAVTLLLTLRMVLFGPMPPRLLDPENDSSSLVGIRERRRASWLARRRTNLLNFPKLGSATLGVLQLHIYVMPDLKEPR
jgi:hypothetical protein